MLYIPTPSQNTLNDFFDLLKDDIISALKKARLNRKVKLYLTEIILKRILISTPDKLISYNYKLLKKAIPNFDEKELEEYYKACKRKAKKKSIRGDISLINRYKQIEEIFKVFDYDKFISGNKERSYSIANFHNRNTCTYCNRLYTHTIVDRNLNKTNKKEGLISRAQFDHWFAKSEYPVLALSFYNLIPSCNICNSSIKGADKFSLNSHCHPFIRERNETFKFSYNLKDATSNNVKLVVNANTKISKTLEAFKIQEVYNSHSHLELKDLLDLAHKYPKNYIKVLLNNTFSSLNMSEEEVYRLIFGVELKESNFHKRPFSKFKKDIIDELKQI